MEDIVYDCIVIGGGVAGLRCATLLHQQKKSVLVLEARDRIGGRTYGIEYNDYMWDVGGQWVGPTQDRLYSLIKECGQHTFPQQQQGKKVIEIDGKTSVYSGLIPPVSLIGLLELQLILYRLERMTLQVDPLEPWKSKNADKWDSITVQDWIDENTYCSVTKKLIHVAFIAVFSCDPKEMSLLFVLNYFRGAGGVMKTLDVPNGAQQDRIFGGSYKLSQTMANNLGLDTIVKLNHEVVDIQQSRNSIFSNIRCSNGRSYHSKLIVIAAPPIVVQSIQFTPPLPTPRVHLQQRMPMGQVIKFIVFYDKCFWRDLGFAGEILTDRESASVLYDGSFEDGSKPSIVGFFEGSAARIWADRSKEERRKEVLDILFKSFNDKRALAPCNYIDMDWMSEKYSLGGYGGYLGPGVLTSVGNALREPYGRIHFAGTETATEWPGYIEGALQSAERASGEVLKHLKTVESEFGQLNNPSYSSKSCQNESSQHFSYKYLDTTITRNHSKSGILNSTTAMLLLSTTTLFLTVYLLVNRQSISILKWFL
ncbi:amine oxidase [Cavenderia fasciculata]|uniref:Amine oxidase n=1 Tax=Cavenderia fasciculata TaxID=261658 RepID=F4PI25_CACFS|nr:amine oxidase [Cavenderia fasciculata]EGG24512.1 amine oxidase [Cavenderia fasciculata]|eukprot:XP_004362363.1 amine oxidase [Cavenderia fasciculata]